MIFLYDINKLAKLYDYNFRSYNKVKKAYNGWRTKLTKKQKQVIKEYRKGTKKELRINALIRANQKSDKVDILKSALENAKLDEKTVTYRYIEKEEYENCFDKHIVGTMVYFKDFKGTHVKRYICEIFKKKHIVAYAIFLLPKGISAAYINDFSISYLNERELLINCNTAWKIVNVVKILHDKNCFVLEYQENVSIKDE